jgi:hypothetical protein
VEASKSQGADDPFLVFCRIDVEVAIVNAHPTASVWGHHDYAISIFNGFRE